MIDYEGLTNLVEKEIDKIVKKGDLTPTEVTNTINAICLLLKLEELREIQNRRIAWGDEDEGRSSMSYPHMRHIGRSGDTWRLSKEDPRWGDPYGRSGDGRQMPRGYGRSGHSFNDRIIARLEQMYGETDNEHEETTLNRLIDMIGKREV